jgi:GT2 family glycosyltransferase
VARREDEITRNGAGVEPIEPEVTVIIPSQTPPAQLTACLVAAAYQNTKRTYRVVVVHSGPDLSGSEVTRLPRVEIIEVDDALLPSAKKNLAVERTGSPWLLFLDSDCIAAPNLLEELLSAAERHGVAGVAASIEIGEPKNSVSWPMHMLEYGRWLPATRPGPCEDFATCGAVYRREQYVAVGGFPEDVFPCCDTTLNAKLIAAGGTLWFTTATSVVHQQWDGREKLLHKNDRYGRAYAITAAKYRLPGHRLRGRLSVPLVFAGRLGRMVARALLYRPLAELPYLVRSAPFAVRATLIWSRGVATGPLPDGRAE